MDWEHAIGNNDIEDAFKALASDGSGGVELSRDELTNLLL